MRKIVGRLVVIVLAGTAAYADDSDELTGWEKTKLAAVYPFAIHQLPLSAVHEGTHALVSVIFGAKVSIHLLPAYVKNADGKKTLTQAHVELKATLHPALESLVILAPYAVQLFVVDRFAEKAYRNGQIRIDSFADKYITNTLQMNEFTPLQDSLSKHGDFALLAERTHIPRYILGALMQTAYIVSYNRVTKARGHRNSTWEFYIHWSF